jgi:TRAP-type C4-dicarboxylate transport system substrate-binding protein
MTFFNGKKTMLLASILTLTSLGTTGRALAETRWDMPTPYGDGTHQTQVARSFAEEVTAQSNGKLTIKVHSGGSLIKHPEIHRAVKSRQVQLGEVFIGRLVCCCSTPRLGPRKTCTQTSQLIVWKI